MAVSLRQEIPPAADMPKETKKALNIDTGLIETLAELIQRTGLTEIEVNEGDVKIRVAKQPAPIAASLPAMAAAPVPVAAQPAVDTAPARAQGASDSEHPGAVRATHGRHRLSHA